MPWVSDVATIVQAWFPGQEAEHSIADMLLGKVTPGGKLPVNFPKRLEDCPANLNFPGDLINRVVEYQEGIYIGYRHFDRLPESVLFPFGFGLSYTEFEIDAERVEISTQDVIEGEKPLNVTVAIRNTGQVNGSEVVQVYASFGDSRFSVYRPTKEFCGFARIELESGTE
ncbi:hypothetical protein N7510_000021 [Penicillium lagena]|uniref:uncharacterized protein n=1 Tax=Penicillium lagena TaxID=94218 RepID=UPI002541FE17|nr:uncharacterized protein N7510_000021 [Penicillium lagena]KAJ5623712.1 hypothetical protein N7510_000021 [Penicillium lagena]